MIRFIWDLMKAPKWNVADSLFENCTHRGETTVTLVHYSHEWLPVVERTYATRKEALMATRHWVRKNHPRQQYKRADINGFIEYTEGVPGGRRAIIFQGHRERKA